MRLLPALLPYLLITAACGGGSDDGDGSSTTGTPGAGGAGDPASSATTSGPGGGGGAPSTVGSSSSIASTSTAGGSDPGATTGTASTSTSGRGSGGTGGDAGAGGASGGLCPAGTLTAPPSQVAGTNEYQYDEYTTSCGPVGTADQAFAFTAPSSGNYVFFAHDAVVSVLSDDCAGAEMACAVSAGETAAAVELPMNAGQAVIVVVDDTSGDFALDALDISCPRFALPSAVSQSTAIPLDYGNDYFTSCSLEPSGADTEVTFVAPVAGTYVFDAHGGGAGAHPVGITLLEAACDGPELACAPPGAAIIRDLAAGEAVVVVVDALGGVGSGFAQLNVGLAAPATCPSGDLGSVLPVTVSQETFTATNDFPSCGWGAWDGDVELTFTAPEDGTYTFDARQSSTQTAIQLLDGVCGGGDLSCNVGTTTLPMAAGQTITVVLDSMHGPGHAVLTVDRLGGACPDESLGALLPVAVSGSTVGADNTALACGDPARLDRIYELVPPEDGFYLFTLDAVAGTAAVSVRDGACDGAEVTCAQAAGTVETTASLLGGAPATIVVDTDVPTDFTLQAQAYPCQVISPTLPGSTAIIPATRNVVTSACGGDGGADAALTFQAPESGRFLFQMQPSGWYGGNDYLMTFDGACGGAPLSCAVSGDYNWTATPPHAVVALAAGESVSLTGSGTQVHVEKLGDACNDGVIAGPLPATVTNVPVSGNDSVGSCAPYAEDADAMLTFTAPASGTYQFSSHKWNGDAGGTLYLLDGTGCGAPELACAVADNYHPHPAYLSAALVANQTVTVVTEGPGSWLEVKLIP